jgi:hypothetical protein
MSGLADQNRLDMCGLADYKLLIIKLDLVIFILLTAIMESQSSVRNFNQNRVFAPTVDDEVQLLHIDPLSGVGWNEVWKQNARGELIEKLPYITQANNKLPDWEIVPPIKEDITRDELLVFVTNLQEQLCEHYQRVRELYGLPLTGNPLTGFPQLMTKILDNHLESIIRFRNLKEELEGSDGGDPPTDCSCSDCADSDEDISDEIVLDGFVPAIEDPFN